jgi:dipeptidyl aminopeptidase/acylaminoacyl peptidase
MATSRLRPRAGHGLAAFLIVLFCFAAVPARNGELPSARLDATAGGPAVRPPLPENVSDEGDTAGPPPAFERMLRDQVATDALWRAASEQAMRMEKITYRSRIDGLEIPAFVFQPLEPAPDRARPALVWVHENIRGHLYEHFIPYVREATAQGYVVIAPEYRGSIGYGEALYDAIDYGGAEVDDVVTAVKVLRDRYPSVDPERVGIIGWSHGGLIALLAVFRNPALFGSAAAIVPVVNLFQRFAWKGVERQRTAVDPENRLGGTPSQRPIVYRERSPLFHVDNLKVPLLVHAAANDEDVEIEEAMPLVDALRARKRALADVKVYQAPAGGHMFDRQIKHDSWEPSNTRDQVDSWSRVWRFFGRTLQGETGSN